MYISRCALSISLLVLVASLLLVLLASIGLPASAAPAAPAQPLRYYHLAGEVFQPRPAGVVDFYGDGCLVNLYGQTLWAPVVLPEGSVLKSVRLYFLDDSVLTMTLSLEAFHDGRGH